MPYYLCANGTINTDGSDLLDIRFNDDECFDYFERCCAIDDVNTIPVLPTSPSTDITKDNQFQRCGLRNKDGIGFRITGGYNESEFGMAMKICNS